MLAYGDQEQFDSDRCFHNKQFPLYFQWFTVIIMTFKLLEQNLYLFQIPTNCSCCYLKCTTNHLFSSRQDLLHTEHKEMQNLKAFIKLGSLSAENKLKLQSTLAITKLVVCVIIIRLSLFPSLFFLQHILSSVLIRSLLADRK